MGARNLFLATLLAILAAAAVASAGYINLTPQLEKWFIPDDAKCADLRLRSLNEGSFNGWVLQTREVFRGEEQLMVRRMLLSRTAEGDILYHGDPASFILDEPITWVDAPLFVGKLWTASHPTADKPDLPANLTHYVFAVLDEQQVTCLLGTYECYRVYVTSIAPDGATDTCGFWYSPACGIIRCDIEGYGAFVLNKARKIPTDLPDVRPIEQDPAGGLAGLATTPNPFNPRTTIGFTLEAPAAVSVAVYDVAGRLVRVVAQSAACAAGPQAFPWDGRDDAGRDVPSGLYVARVQAGAAAVSRTMMLVR